MKTSTFLIGRRCSIHGYAVRPFRRGDLLRGFVKRAKVRNASLTARAFGKISETSGSSRTMFVPSAYRAAVTPLVAFEKSYSGRIVSSSEASFDLFLLFFISFSL